VRNSGRLRPTLVFIRHHEINGRLYRHAEELPPGALSQEIVNQLLDQGVLREYAERRSLYRLFAPFSGCKEIEELDAHELSAYGLPK
jgi:hypothetical protein